MDPKKQLKPEKRYNVEVYFGKRHVETAARNISYAMAVTKRDEMQRSGRYRARNIWIEPVNNPGGRAPKEGQVTNQPPIPTF